MDRRRARPVLVGAGIAHQRFDDPAEAAEAVALMTTAVERAGDDAHAPGLLAQAGAVFVPRGTLALPRSRSDRRRARRRERAVGDRRARRAAAHAVHTCVSRHRERRSRRRDRRGRRSEVPRPARPHHRHRAGRHRAGRRRRARREHPSRRRDHPRARARRRLHERAADVLGAGDRAPRVARANRWPRTRGRRPSCGRRSAAPRPPNPDAWRRDPVPPEFLEHPSAKNPMLAAPYTKWHCSQWNVDQAAAFVLCSTEAADRAGVPQDRRVYPLAVVESNHMLAVSRRARAPPRPGGPHRRRAHRRAHRHRRDGERRGRPLQLLPGRRCASRRASSGLPLDDPDGRPLSVGGGMTFGGGPLNNATFQALARMVPMLRDAAGHHRPAHLHQRDHHQARHVGVVDDAARARRLRVRRHQRRRRRGHPRARGGRRPPRRRRRSTRTPSRTRAATPRYATDRRDRRPTARAWSCACDDAAVAADMAATNGAAATSTSTATGSAWATELVEHRVGVGAEARARERRCRRARRRR